MKKIINDPIKVVHDMINGMRNTLSKSQTRLR